MKYFSLLSFVIVLTINAQERGEVIIDNGRIAYQAFGEGYPVVIINGGPGMNSNGFAPLAKLLSENNTIIIYDQRGTGESTMHEVNASTITMDLMVEDIENLCKELGYKNWIILGHSFGGMLAYEYAAQHPERVKAMIQSHSGGMDIDVRNRFDVRGRLTATQLDSLNYYTTKISLGDASEATALKRAEFLAPAYLHDDSLATKIAPRLTQVNMMINSYIWNDLRSIPFNNIEEMKNFEKPVLILHGQNEVVPVNVAEKAHKILPSSKLVIMPECGHYGWLERPDIYLKEVKDFLKLNSKEAN